MKIKIKYHFIAISQALQEKENEETKSHSEIYFAASSYVKLSKERQSAIEDKLPCVILQIAIYAEGLYKERPFVFYYAVIRFVRVDIKVGGEVVLLVAELLIFALFAETSYLYHNKSEL